MWQITQNHCGKDHTSQLPSTMELRGEAKQCGGESQETSQGHTLKVMKPTMGK